ncbi:MAG: LytTR family transcriptional regulator [Clostridia bacterium]|nr:LytTR family transcriptional regulator [Clostridia bacterium]
MKETFMFSEKKNHDEIYFEDIVFFESRGHYILVHTKDGETYRTRSSVEKLFERLDEKVFKRTHRAFIVNLQYAKGMENNTLQLNSVWDLVPVSRTYKGNLTGMMVETI